MPVAWHKTYAEITYSGTMTKADVRRNEDSVYGNSRYENIRGILICCENVTSIELNNLDVVEAGVMDRASVALSRIKRLAYVVPPDPDAEHAAMAYTKLMEAAGIDARIFKDRAEARSWIEEV